MKTLLVYLIRNLVNGKLYVGQTSTSIAQRWREHKSNAVRGRKCALHSAIQKYGSASFSVEKLQECLTKEEMDFVEILYIALFKSRAPAGYNLTEGGDWVYDRTGSKLSSEHKEAIRRGNLGRKHPPCTEEYRRKQRESHLGHAHSEAHKQHQSEGLKRAYALGRATGMLGKKHSEETKSKLRGPRGPQKNARKVWSQARRDASF
jgi:group I intron endonuclease